MDQVNLMLMFSLPAAAPLQSAGGSTGNLGAEFAQALQLQAAISAAGLPAAAANTGGPADAASGFSVLTANMGQRPELQQTFAAPDLLAALSASIAQILDAAQPQPAATTAGDSPLMSAQVQAELPEPLTLLLKYWPELGQVLQQQLATRGLPATQLELNWPEVGGKPQQATATPWSARPSADSSASALPLDLPLVNTGYAQLEPAARQLPLLQAARPQPANEVPASVQWFNTAAGSETAAAAGLPGGAGQGLKAEAVPPVAALQLPAPALPQSAPLITLLPTVGAAPLAIRLVADSATAETVNFRVQLSQPGSAELVLDAKLTLQRSVPQVQPGLQPTEARLPQPAVLPAAPLTEARAVPAARPLLLNEPVAATPARLPNVYSPQVQLPAVMTAQGSAAVVAELAELAPAVVAANRPRLTQLVAEPGSPATAPTHAQQLADASTAQEARNWQVEEALRSFVLTRNLAGKLSAPAAELSVKRIQPLAASEPQSGSYAVQLPAAAVSTTNLPMQLLQFASSQAATQPYTGLQYAELTQQLLAETAQARAAGNGLYHARLELNPPELGQMYVNISVRGETVSLQLAVVSAAPREQLRESLNQLHQSLAEAGLDVVELRVVTLDEQQDQPQQRRQESGESDEPAAKSIPQVMPLKDLPFVSQLFDAAPAAS